jgi:hypothetical protein
MGNQKPSRTSKQRKEKKKKRKRTKGQTMTYTTLHRNRMIEQYDPTENHV